MGAGWVIGRRLPCSVEGVGEDLRVDGAPSPTLMQAKLTSFVGRGEELDRVEELLGRHRLVTLIGPGGSGKTRLAVEAGERLKERFDEGLFLVELAQVTDPDLVVNQLAAALGVAEHQDLSLLDAVATVAGRRHILVLLDNCEHVVAAAADVCAALLTAGDDLRVIATSRQALGVPGEALVPVGPLAVPSSDQDTGSLGQFDAVSLFAARAADVDSGLELTQATAGLVAAIVRRLDGMPLAIELAAAQLDVFGLQDLLSALEDRFAILVSRTHSAPARQATLAATVDWGYRLLVEGEQRAFRGLSVFPAPFTMDAAARVVGSDAQAIVASLVRRSMLVPHRSGADGSTRYSMLETLRAYGSRLLDEHGERDGVEGAVASWALEDAERMAALFETPNDAPISAWGDAEQENLRSALEWFIERDAISAARLSVAVAPWWFLRGHYREGTGVLGRILELLAGASDGVVVRVEDWTARLYSYSGHFRLALDHYGRVDDLLAGVPGPTPQHVESLIGQTIALFNLSEMSLAKTRGEKALKMARALSYGSGECFAASTLAVRSLYEGDFPKAFQLAEEAMRVDPSSVWGHAWRWATSALGNACLVVGDLDRAERAFVDNLERCRGAGDRSWAASQLDALARIEIQTGRREQAQVHVAESMRISFDIGDRLRLADCFATAAVALASAYPEEAAMLWGAGRNLAEVLGCSRIALVSIIDQADPDSIYDSNFVTDPMIGLRDHLGTGRAGAADQKGFATPLDAAVQLALRVLSEPPPEDTAVGSQLSRLSSRERELVGLVAEGMTDAEIAEKLFISIRTVRSHLDRIRDKTGCRRRAELTRLALGD